MTGITLLQAAKPIIVKVLKEPEESTTIVDVLVGSLGLTMVLLLAAIVLGAVLGGVMIGIKLLRARYNIERPSESESLRVTPHGSS